KIPCPHCVRINAAGERPVGSALPVQHISSSLRSALLPCVRPRGFNAAANVRRFASELPSKSTSTSRKDLVDRCGDNFGIEQRFPKPLQPILSCILQLLFIPK